MKLTQFLINAPFSIVASLTFFESQWQLNIQVHTAMKGIFKNFRSYYNADTLLLFLGSQEEWKITRVASCDKGRRVNVPEIKF